MDDDQHIADELIDLALGHAAGGTEAAAGHLRRCARCRAELAACRETLAALALAQPPVAPASSVRRRLLESLAASPAWPWSIALARLFDVTVARAHSLWSGLAAPSAWIATPLPGFAIAHAEGGDGTRGAYTGFAKMAAGLRFPAHRHLGPESMLILSGGIRLADGRSCHAGELVRSDGGTTHDFVVLKEAECIAAVVQHGGVEFRD